MLRHADVPDNIEVHTTEGVSGIYRASRDYKLKWTLFQRGVYNVIERVITADGSKLPVHVFSFFF